MDTAADVNTDLLQRFIQYAGAIFAQVQVVANQEAAAAALATIRQGDLKCTAAIRDQYPVLYAALATDGVPAMVAEEVEAAHPGRAALGAALDGGTGLVLARAGIAETGSLVLAEAGLAARLVSMLTDVCVAVLPVSALVPSLDEAGDLLARLEYDGHRYMSFVTGPSRTGDIEMALTVGVHGPRALHILILEDA
jgi:L-lactate dehydrogenase complex protein LldG